MERKCFVRRWGDVIFASHYLDKWIVLSNAVKTRLWDNVKIGLVKKKSFVGR